MRGLYLILLTILLCYNHAMSLQCFSYTGLQTTNQSEVISCGGGSSVCYKSNLILTLRTGQQTKVYVGSCAPSCKKASETVNIATTLMHSPQFSKTEVQDLSCCVHDLCNGVTRAGRSLLALAGGLLLSLGTTLLWALL